MIIKRLMNPELMHQLYGGDIADYIPRNIANPSQKFNGPYAFESDGALANVYETQIKGKPAIDTSGLQNSVNLSHLIVRDNQPTSLEIQLRQTLNNVADVLGLNDEPGSYVFNPASVKLNTQTADDIAAANSNVLQALKELQAMSSAI